MKLRSVLQSAGAAFTALAIFSAYAQPLINNITGLYKTAGAPHASKPVLCVKDQDNQFHQWTYGTRLDPNQISGNPYYWGAAVRLESCSDHQPYLGWMDVSGTTIKYQAPRGIHIHLLESAIADNKVNGHLGYTRIGVATGDDFPSNRAGQKPDNTHWFTGVNLSGFEFSTMPNATVLPNLSESDRKTKYSDLDATAHFLNEGANIIRLPIRWAYIKPYGPAPDTMFDEDFFTKLYLPALATLTSHHYYAIVDLHAYMHYATVGNQVAGCGGPDHQCPDGGLNKTIQDYVHVWTKMWQHIQQHEAIESEYIFVDLVNEPAISSQQEKLTPKEVFTMEVAIIKALRQQGFDGYFLVEGVAWSGLHSWKSAGNASQFTRKNFKQAGIKDLNRIVINVHQYLDSDFSGTHNRCIAADKLPEKAHLQSFINYLKDNHLKAMVTEFGVGRNQDSCTRPLKVFLKYMSQNAYTPDAGYGFIGWTAWSTGHGWGNYNLRITPDGWKDEVIAEHFKRQHR